MNWRNCPLHQIWSIWCSHGFQVWNSAWNLLPFFHIVLVSIPKRPFHANSISRLSYVSHCSDGGAYCSAIISWIVSTMMIDVVGHPLRSYFVFAQVTFRSIKCVDKRLEIWLVTCSNHVSEFPFCADYIFAQVSYRFLFVSILSFRQSPQLIYPSYKLFQCAVIVTPISLVLNHRQVIQSHCHLFLLPHTGVTEANFIFNLRQRPVKRNGN